jgi:hypothetical protein
MKKLTMLLPAMIAAALPLQATADVSWSGRVQVEVASGDTEGKSGLRMGDTYNDDGNASYLGATFSDGDAFGKINLNLNHFKNSKEPEGNPQFRDVYAGMKMGPGSLKLGRFSSAYKTAGGVKYDPFLSTGLQARGNGGQSAGQNGYIEAIGYSAKMAGVKVNVNYGLDNPDVATSDTALSASVAYGIAGGEVFFAMSDNFGYTGNKVGGKYAMGDTSLRVQIELPDSDSHDTQRVFVGAEHKIAGMTVGGWFGMSTIGDADAVTSMAFGAKKSMGKKTSAYAGFKIEGAADDGDAKTALVVGMRTGF